jgi:Mg-chelatase subunit ChlD
VLLTDGLPTAAGDIDAVAEAQSAAAALAASGADVYIVGLGQQVDQTFIRSIASDPDNAYLAPSRSDLAAIYDQITASLCEVGPTKIEVIAKTKTNFAPLR